MLGSTRPNQRSHYRPRTDITACRNPPEEFRLLSVGPDGNETSVSKGTNGPENVGDMKKALGTHMANVRTMLAYTRTALSLLGGSLGLLKLSDPDSWAKHMLIALAIFSCFFAVYSVVVYEMTRRQIKAINAKERNSDVSTEKRFLYTTVVAAVTALGLFVTCALVVWDHVDNDSAS